DANCAGLVTDLAHLAPQRLHLLQDEDDCRFAFVAIVVGHAAFALAFAALAAARLSRMRSLCAAFLAALASLGSGLWIGRVPSCSPSISRSTSAAGISDLCLSLTLRSSLRSMNS